MFHFYMHDPKPFDLYAVEEDSFGWHCAPSTAIWLGEGEGDNVAEAWNDYRRKLFGHPVKDVVVDARKTAAYRTWHFTYEA